MCRLHINSLEHKYWHFDKSCRNFGAGSDENFCFSVCLCTNISCSCSYKILQRMHDVDTPYGQCVYNRMYASFICAPHYKGCPTKYKIVIVYRVDSDVIIAKLCCASAAILQHSSNIIIFIHAEWDSVTYIYIYIYIHIYIHWRSPIPPNTVLIMERRLLSCTIKTWWHLTPLQALCEGNQWLPVNSPHKGLLMRCF